MSIGSARFNIKNEITLPFDNKNDFKLTITCVFNSIAYFSAIRTLTNLNFLFQVSIMFFFDDIIIIKEVKFNRPKV